MTAPFYLFLAGAGATVGFFSGLLGIGGGILMFPLLLYLPPALGLGAIPVKSITGLTMAQGFFASLSAMFLYHREQLVHRGLVVNFGVSLFISSLAGSLLSKQVPDRLLLFIFASLALTAAAMMLMPRSYARDELREGQVSFPRLPAVAIGLTTGFLTGLVGQGGAFITIPLMLYVLKVPLRVTLGSTLAVGLFSATAGMIGKVATGQVPFLPAVALVAGAIPAARFGGWVGRRTGTVILRWLLALIISATAVKVWTDIF